MPFDTKQIKRDQGTNPIPQIFSPTLDDYEAVKGLNGAMYTIDSRIVLWAHAGNLTSTEALPLSTYFSIKNDGASDLSFTIGSITISVKSGETFGESFATFTSVIITTTGAYRAYSKG